MCFSRGLWKELKQIPFISDRETVTIREIRRDFPEPDDICIYQKSIEHPHLPVKKGVIRANLELGFYIMRPTDTGMEMICGEQFDLMGSVPKSLMTMGFASENGLLMEALYETVKKYEGRISVDILAHISPVSFYNVSE